MRITVHKNNRHFEQINCSSSRANSNYKLFGEHQIEKYVKVPSWIKSLILDVFVSLSVGFAITFMLFIMFTRVPEDSTNYYNLY